MLKRIVGKTILSATLISMLLYTIVLAASGDLDPTFDNDGWVTTDFSWWGPEDSIRDIAIQPNGKIVAVGNLHTNFAVTRYNTDGSLDSTFHIDGRLVTDFGAGDSAY